MLLAGSRTRADGFVARDLPMRCAPNPWEALAAILLAAACSDIPVEPFADNPDERPPYDTSDAGFAGARDAGIVAGCPWGDFKTRCHPNDGFCCARAECYLDEDCVRWCPAGDFKTRCHPRDGICCRAPECAGVDEDCE